MQVVASDVRCDCCFQPLLNVLQKANWTSLGFRHAETRAARLEQVSLLLCQWILKTGKGCKHLVLGVASLSESMKDSGSHTGSHVFTTNGTCYSDGWCESVCSRVGHRSITSLAQYPEFWSCRLRRSTPSIVQNINEKSLKLYVHRQWLPLTTTFLQQCYWPILALPLVQLKGA